MMNNAAKPLILFTTQLAKKEQESIEKKGISINVEPFITFEYLLPSLWMDRLPENSDAWVFTSKKAVKALNPVINDLKPPKHIFAVGPKTGKKLDKMDMDIEVPEEYNLVALAEKMKKLELKQVTHFCGNLKAGDLNALLGDETKVSSVEVYNTKPTPHALDISPYQGVVFMSPSAVASFSEQNRIDGETQVFCIGPTTKTAANKAGFKSCITPKSSTLDCLGDSIQSYFN
jgi:uroporphyrinogen-III synthase